MTTQCAGCIHISLGRFQRNIGRACNGLFLNLRISVGVSHFQTQMIHHLYLMMGKNWYNHGILWWYVLWLYNAITFYDYLYHGIHITWLYNPNKMELHPQPSCTRNPSLVAPENASRQRGIVMKVSRAAHHFSRQAWTKKWHGHGRPWGKKKKNMPQASNLGSYTLGPTTQFWWYWIVENIGFNTLVHVDNRSIQLITIAYYICSWKPST